MSNFNVQKDSWLELVFEDKNKAYGAYQLRKENDTTTLKALFFAIVLVASGVGLLSFTTPKTETKPPIVGPTLEPSVVYVEPKNDQPKEEENFGKENTKKNDTPKPSDIPEIVNINTTKPDIPTNNLPYNPNGTENGGNNGTEGNPSKPNLGNNENPEGGNGGNGTNSNPVNILTEGASFPGGIDKFRTLVAEKFKTPDEFDKDFLTFELAFIIEEDGSMSDIRMISKADKALEKEAIRVLKSISKKWTPGKVNGVPVKSEKTMKIKIDLKEIEE